MTQRDLEKKFLSRKLSTATAEDLKNEAFRYWLLYSLYSVSFVTLIKCICSERRKIVESSIEIRELESKLKMAYILKERKKQLDEKESIRVMEKVCK